MRSGGAFALSLTLTELVIGSAGVVSAALHVLLQVQVTGPSGVDVTNIFIKAVGVGGMSLTPTNNERQLAALLRAPDIHSNVIL